MKYFLCFFLIGCFLGSDKEDAEKISVTYETNAHKVDVTYCREDGSITAEYNVYKFQKTIEIPSGGKVCISAKKLIENNNIDIRVYIKSGDFVLFTDRGEMEASVSGVVY